MKHEAKMKALMGMRKVASDMMKDGIKGKLSKVTVAADSPDKLQEGLDKAKDLLKKGPMDDTEEKGEMEESPEEEASESPEEEAKETDPTSDEQAMTPEELDEKIKKLMALKEEKLHNG